MKTVNDVLALGSKVRISQELFGSDPEFAAEYRRRFKAIGTAIAGEQHLPADFTGGLDPATGLGADSQRLLEELEAWLKTTAFGGSQQPRT